LLEQDSDAGREPLAALAGMLRRMQDHPAPRFGKVGVVDGDLPVSGDSGVRIILDGALKDVEEAAARDERIRAGRSALIDTLQGMAARVTAPARVGLIHGELGPDHVLVSPDGTPVLIDIEWEHVFVRMRFGRHYAPLSRDDLDADRMRLFQLAMHVSLVAGPLRIASGDHPQAPWFRDLAAMHTGFALDMVTAGASGL
jgi:hypothetical protein